MAQHKHGSMDTTNQQKTFDGFLRFVVIGAAITIAILVFAALVNG